MSSWISRTCTIVAALGSFLLAYGVRELHHGRVRQPSGGWITMDSDSEYHMRRLERALVEPAPIASVDPYLNYPEGARIPWPPYYTLFLQSVLEPFAPQEASQRHRFVEQGVASVPQVLGSLTAVVAFVAGAGLASPTAALFAGGQHALSLSSITYSRAGNGDHHAWVALLSGVLLAWSAHGLRRGALRQPRLGALYGAGAGILAGVLLGSWVASMLYVLGMQLILAGYLFWHVREPRAGLASFGSAFHLCASIVLLPAVFESPWLAEDPWSVVNLSYFHPSQLALGMCVFLPLFCLRRGSLVERHYPYFVGACLAAVIAVVCLSGRGPAAALGEGFAWLQRGEEFMAQVGESLPLVGAGSGFPWTLVRELGWLGLAAPLLVLPALWLAWRRRDESLWLWSASVAWLYPQALAQRRFAEALALPLAVLGAWAWQVCVQAWLRRRKAAQPTRTQRTILGSLGALLLLVLSQGSVHGKTSIALLRVGGSEPNSEQRAALAARELADWIRQNTPVPADYAVLANWGNGHLIEWAADRPSVATNFGSYVGRTGFEAPARFFMAEDPLQAEQILRERRARYVLLLSGMPRFVGELVSLACPSERSRYLASTPGQASTLLDPFFDTQAARLLLGGVRMHANGPPGPSLDYLRLVHVSPHENAAAPLALAGVKRAFGFVWEHVPGARLQVQAEPGSELLVQIRLRYPAAGYALQFRRKASADERGRVDLRVPYATLSPNGDGIVVESRYQIGERSGSLQIAEQQVLEGATLTLP